MHACVCGSERRGPRKRLASRMQHSVRFPHARHLVTDSAVKGVKTGLDLAQTKRGRTASCCSTLATASGCTEQSHGAPRLCSEHLVPRLRLAPLQSEYFGERLVLLLLGVKIVAAREQQAVDAIAQPREENRGENG